MRGLCPRKDGADSGGAAFRQPAGRGRFAASRSQSAMIALPLFVLISSPPSRRTCYDPHPAPPHRTRHHRSPSPLTYIGMINLGRPSRRRRPNMSSTSSRSGSARPRPTSSVPTVEMETKQVEVPTVTVSDGNSRQRPIIASAGARPWFRPSPIRCGSRSRRRARPRWTARCRSARSSPGAARSSPAARNRMRVGERSDRPCRDGRDPRGGRGARHLPSRRLRPVGDAGALRDVRRRDRPGADRPPLFRRARPEGRRGAPRRRACSPSRPATTRPKSIPGWARRKRGPCSGTFSRRASWRC